MQQQPPRDPLNPTNQLWQPAPNPQSGRPGEPSPRNEMPQPQPYLPQQGYSQAAQPAPQPQYNPAMPGTPWPQPQPQPYPPQQGYPQAMQPAPNYNPAMPGNPWPQPQPYPSQQMMYPQTAQGPVQVTAVNVNVNAQQKNNGCVRALYFVFIGWWLGFWCLEIGFFLCAIIITLPLGLMILNRLPQIMTLKPAPQTTRTNVNVTSVGVGGASVNTVNVSVSTVGIQQHSMLVRAVYYIFVGCWVGYIWASLAYLLCLSIFGLPLGILMLNMLPAVLTLRKS